MSTQTQPTNGNGHQSIGPRLSNPALSTHPKTSTGKVVGGPPLPLPLDNQLYELGFDVARLSLRQQADPDDEKRVEQLCRAVARKAKREPYDPINDLHDKKIEAENERNKEQRERLDEKLDHAGRAVRAAKNSKAQLPPANKPKIPLTIMFLSAFLVAASLCPTFSDFFFFTVADPALRWFYSIAAGALVGFVISWAALRYVDLKGGGNEARLLNGFLIGAFLMALALGGIRLASAASSEAIIFALSLTGMELAVFLILELLARRFRASFQEYQERFDAHSMADRTIENAAEHYNDVLSQRTAKQAEIDAHHEYVEARKLFHTNIDRIEEAAAQIGLLGYRAGIGANRSEAILP